MLGVPVTYEWQLSIHCFAGITPRHTVSMDTNHFVIDFINIIGNQIRKNTDLDCGWSWRSLSRSVWHGRRKAALLRNSRNNRNYSRPMTTMYDQLTVDERTVYIWMYFLFLAFANQLTRG